MSHDLFGNYMNPECQVLEHAGSGYSTTVSGSTSANTWGSWTQLIAATTHSTNWLEVDVTQPFPNVAGAHIMAVQLGIGGAGSEIAWTPPLIVDAPFAFVSGKSWSFPVPHVIAGTRISARVRCDAANAGCSMRVSGHLHSMNHALNQHAEAYGQLIDGSNTQGTTIDPGATINTKGAWVQISSFVNQEHRWLIVNLTAANNAMTNAVWTMDIAIGDITNKYNLLTDVNFGARASEDLIYPNVLHYWCYLGRSRMIFARAQCSINDATDRLFDLDLICGG